MPKMKTKSAAKKRFKITGTGKVLSAAAGKRHGMIKRSNKFIRDARGTMVLAEADGNTAAQREKIFIEIVHEPIPIPVAAPLSAGG